MSRSVPEEGERGGRERGGGGKGRELGFCISQSFAIIGGAICIRMYLQLEMTVSVNVALQSLNKHCSTEEEKEEVTQFNPHQPHLFA